MRFEDLEIGAEFWFSRRLPPHVKISSTMYRDPGGYFWKCKHADCETTGSKLFKDLVIGARFRFADDIVRVKVTEDECRMPSGMVVTCSNKKCIPVFESKRKIFKQLAVGDAFRFPDDTEIHIKIAQVLCMDSVGHIFHCVEEATVFVE